MSVRRFLISLILPLAACDCSDEPSAPIADAVMMAPHADPGAFAGRLKTLGITKLMLTHTDPTLDMVALDESLAGIDLIVGLTPTRPFASEWNAPTAAAAGLLEAVERALLVRNQLAGVHLDHAEPLLPDDELAAYLDATVQLIRTETDVPISVALRSRRIDHELLGDAGFPAPPPGTTIAEVDDHLKGIAWADAWANLLGPRVERVIVHTNNAARQKIETAAREIRVLKERLGSDAEIWASVDAVTVMGGRYPMARPLPEIEQEISALRAIPVPVVVRGAEWFEPDRLLAREGRTRAEPRDLAFLSNLDLVADDMNRRLRRCCLRDGQIVTVYDHRYERDHGPNLWQEDACWLTGLYTSAMSFKYAVTKDPEAEKQARSAWRALHQMANTTPMRGDIVRNYVRSLYSQTRPVQPGSDTIKRWRRATDKEIYWAGDISVDQLSGWFNGVTVYFDLVASEAERAEIKADITAVMEMFLDNNLRAIEFTGEHTTFGDLRGQPVLALSFFQTGYHITKDERYRVEFERLIDEEGMHFRTANVLAIYHSAGRYGSDHFYSSGFYPLLLYETDPTRRAQLDLGLQIFHQLKRRFGDAYADTVYAVFNPTSDTRRRAASELVHFRPELTENAQWLRDFTALHQGPFVPVDQRPAAELDFDYGPPGPKGLRGGMEHRFGGIGYLIAYWMGRYHGLITREP